MFYYTVYNCSIFKCSFKKIADELCIGKKKIARTTVNHKAKIIEPFFKVLEEQNQELVDNLLNDTRIILYNSTLSNKQKINNILKSKSFKEVYEKIENIKKQGIQNNNTNQQQNKQLINNNIQQQNE